MKNNLLKLISIMLTLVVVLTTCAFAVGTASAINQAIYYVSPNGDDTADGTDVSTPLKTVDAAIVKAKAAGYGAGDTVYIKLIKTMNGDTEVSNIWKFTDSRSQLTAHSFNLNISSYGEKARIGYASDVCLGGDTYFDNVTIVTGNSSHYPNFDLAGHNVSFSANSSSPNIFSAFVTSWLGSPTEDVNYYFACDMGAPLTFGGVWNNKTFNNNFTITVDGGASSAFKFGDRGSSSGSATYNKNINFRLDNASALSLSDYYNPKFGDSSAIQIINSTGNTAITGSAKNYVSTKTTVNGNSLAYYIINNSLGKADNIEFTDTKGKFKINVDLEIYDIKVNGQVAVIEDGYLILEDFGEYDITKAEKPGTELTYYVKNGATGGNGGESTPFGTVAEAITAAKTAGLGKIDTLNVKLLDNSSLGTLPEYNFTAIVESKTDKVSLNIGENAIANGKTVYKNVSITANVLDLAGKNVIIENNVDLTVGEINAINAKAAISAKLSEVDILTGENADIVINNADTVATIAFANADYGRVKINIKSADKIDFSGNLNATDTVEIALNSNTEISGLEYENITAINGKWYIDNKCNLEFDFTDTAGELSYMGEKSVELISQDNTYVPTNSLIVAQPGKYEFDLKEFTMKTLDKGYVTFIFDDANMPFTKEVADLFNEFGMPMSCAVPAYKVKRCSELHRVLLGIQENGGEILSHGYNHWAITSETTKASAEKQIIDAWRHLTTLGFNVNGMIEVGNGGGEATADYEMVESILRNYYKYSNYGVSEQYDKSRRFMNWDSMSSIRNRITNAGNNKEWIILSAHGYGEISSDQATTDTTRLREILQYIKDKNGAVEVVTWNYMYENFAEYNGPQIPTAEAMASLDTYVDNISDKNITHEYDSACDKVCNGCGFIREASDHQYDNACDSDCNECGELRIVGDHEYSGICDTNCDICNEARETTQDHVYDNDCDADCNVCGDVRTIADGFIKEDGVYYYYEDGVKSTATTLVKVNGSWFYLENGAWTKKTALVKYSGSYFYVINGKWNSKTTDLIKYNGSWFYVKNGKWNKTTDLIKKDGVYFFVKNGKWSTAITTLFKKNGKFFSIKSGKWSKTTQIITYSGKKFYCKSGFAQLGFTGKAKVGSKTYNIVKGQVK